MAYYVSTPPSRLYRRAKERQISRTFEWKKNSGHEHTLPFCSFCIEIMAGGKRLNPKASR